MCQVKIDIVKELSKQATVEVPSNKNIIINLNGHKFTNVVNEPVLVNYGKTVLIDEGEDGILESENNILATGSFAITAL